MDEHTLNDLLECSVCLERLDTSSKVLPCQHTFCRKCLEVIYVSRQELRCPECRVLVDIKIDDLPPNVLLMRILEGMKNAASKQHSSIELTKDKMESGQTSANDNALSSAGVNSTANEERIRQQMQQQQVKQRQQEILQFQQQIQQRQNQSTTAQHQLLASQMQQNLNQNQQRRGVLPHAYAIYDFESNETSDLKFKKGDLIYLKRKIDNNWYVGLLNGIEGNFPVNYVQIVVPLPSSQCMALYDFKMGPNEEEGCLTFKKGTVIQVLRRVDHNWAEGRIGAVIGIFPIAFVELNQMAKQLLEGYASSSSNTATQQSSQYIAQSANNDVRNPPPLPPVTDSSINNGGSSPSSSSVPLDTNAAPSSSSNSSTTTSPTATSASISATSNSVSFHSMPNSPLSSMPSSPQHSSASVTTNMNSSNSVRMRYNELKHKRHSLNALLNNGATALSIMQSNRHSAEILSVPNDFDNEAQFGPTVAVSDQSAACRDVQPVYTSNMPANSNQQSSRVPQNETSTTTSSITSQQPSRHNVLKTFVQQNVPPCLPWGYLALYPYKPRKTDELELKKGCVYMVTERCLDGWFKGKNWQDISGVFPGNYVTPLRVKDQQQLMHSWKYFPPSAAIQSNSQTVASETLNQPTSTVSTTANHTTSQQQLSPSYPASIRNALENINARLTLANLTPHQALPPDLPPRYLTISPTPTAVANSSTTIMSAKENRDKEAQKEKPTTIGCISTSTSSSTSSASTGLKKFLTHIKSRSKSPSASVAAATAANIQTHNNSTHQNPYLQKPSAQNLHTQMPNVNTSSLTPVHVRSGSCPSQLLQNLPNDVQQHNVIENKKPNVPSAPQQLSPHNNYASHRVIGAKENTSMENSRPTIDSTLRSIYANQLQQQPAPAGNKCGQQYQMAGSLLTKSHLNFNNPTSAIHHRKSNSLDASNILHSSPIVPTRGTFPNNSLGLNRVDSGEGNVAAVKTSVPQCSIKAGAVHSNTTTKSAQNMSEGRFRCVVPYPPNSDVELELQVGDIIFVQRKQKNGWYKGTNPRTYKTGLFPASFVEPDI